MNATLIGAANTVLSNMLKFRGYRKKYPGNSKNKKTAIPKTNKSAKEFFDFVMKNITIITNITPNKKNPNGWNSSLRNDFN